MAILDQHCESVGRDPSEIQRSAVALLFVSDDDAFVKKMKESSPQPVLAGNLNEIRDTVAAYSEAGVNELLVPDFTLGQGQEKIDQLDRFINAIAPVARN